VSHKVNFLVILFLIQGISIDPERVIAIQNLQAPTSKKEIQSFMGKINFVRRFIPDFARMVKPIHNMLKQDRSFSWNDDTKKYFVEVKKAISSAPVLAKPNFEALSEIWPQYSFSSPFSYTIPSLSLK
jgi:hypothetical protein